MRSVLLNPRGRSYWRDRITSVLFFSQGVGAQQFPKVL